MYIFVHVYIRKEKLTQQKKFFHYSFQLRMECFGWILSLVTYLPPFIAFQQNIISIFFIYDINLNIWMLFYLSLFTKTM